MEFRDKIEAFVTPLVEELRKKLAELPTLTALDYYQFRIDAAKPDKSNVPDGFLFKWRYLWAQLLSNPFLEAKGTFELELRNVDELIEKIFETYEFGAICEPGRFRGSEKEFLTRLGLALKVREPDILAFPEQIREWALARLEPFNNSYFLPTFGLSFAEIVAWFTALITTSQARLDAWVKDFTSIIGDIKSIQAAVGRGDLDEEGARNKAFELKIHERLESNGRQSDRAHIFSIDELRCGISQSSVGALVGLFGIRPRDVEPGYVFPHHENPLEYKTFVVLPNGNLYFLDPGNA